MAIKTQDRVVPYVQKEGRGTALAAMSIKRHGLGDLTDGTIPGRGVLFGRDEFGRPDVKVEFDEPPSGLNTATITFDAEANLDYLDTMRRENGKFGIANFYIPKGRLSNYRNWANGGSLDYLAGCKISGGGKGGREKDFSGQPIANTYELSWRNTLELLPPKLVDSSPTAAVSDFDVNCIAFLSDLDPNQDIPGYPGPDKLGFFGDDGDATTAANVAYTLTAGGSWANLSALPFAAITEGIIAIAVRFITHDTYRVVCLRGDAVVADAPEIAYADILLGDESATPTWFTVDCGAVANDPGEAMAWLLFDRLYIGAGGDIFVSTDQGTSVPTAVVVGANAIADFVIDWEQNVWASGAAGTILKESANNRGVFDGLVAPTGNPAMGGLAIARDGYVFAGGGTALWLSTNGAATVGNWVQLADFTANHAVKRIQCVDGESQILRVLVEDSTGFDGDVWYSLDGGNSLVEITDLSNAGYNDWYVSEVDPNLVFIAGEDDATNGVVHKLIGAA